MTRLACDEDREPPPALMMIRICRITPDHVPPGRTLEDFRRSIAIDVLGSLERDSCEGRA